MTSTIFDNVVKTVADGAELALPVVEGGGGGSSKTKHHACTLFYPVTWPDLGHFLGDKNDHIKIEMFQFTFRRQGNLGKQSARS